MWSSFSRNKEKHCSVSGKECEQRNHESFPLVSYRRFEETKRIETLYFSAWESFESHGSEIVCDSINFRTHWIYFQFGRNFECLQTSSKITRTLGKEESFQYWTFPHSRRSLLNKPRWWVRLVHLTFFIFFSFRFLLLNHDLNRAIVESPIRIGPIRILFDPTYVYKPE